MATYEKLMVRNKEDVVGVFYFENKEDAEDFAKDIARYVSPEKENVKEKYRDNAQALRFFDVFEAVHEMSKQEKQNAPQESPQTDGDKNEKD